MNRAKEVEN